MNKDVEIEKLTISIGGTKIELSPEEANELYAKLGECLGKEPPNIPFFTDPPVFFESLPFPDPPQLPWKFPVITCDKHSWVENN